MRPNYPGLGEITLLAKLVEPCQERRFPVPGIAPDMPVACSDTSLLAGDSPVKERRKSPRERAVGGHDYAEECIEVATEQ